MALTIGDAGQAGTYKSIRDQLDLVRKLAPGRVVSCLRPIQSNSQDNAPSVPKKCLVSYDRSKGHTMAAKNPLKKRARLAGALVFVLQFLLQKTENATFSIVDNYDCYAYLVRHNSPRA